ncbi:MAG: NusG domain [Firmicutes bacterium]|nr:NusG domain [Bacillota bacterium]
MRLTLADKWLIGGLLLLAGLGIGWHIVLASRLPGQKAEIYKDGNLVETVPLRNGYRQVIRLGDRDSEYNIVEVQDGKVRIVEADCPDQLCVRMGWASAAPTEIVCLPNKVVVKVVSVQPADIDEITR